MPAIASLEYEREKPVDFRQPEEKERVMSNMNNAKRSARLSSYAMAAVVVPVSSADVLHNTLDQSFDLSLGETDVLQFTSLTVTKGSFDLGPFSISFSIDWTSAGRMHLDAVGGWTSNISTRFKVDSSGDINTSGSGHTIEQRFDSNGYLDRNTAGDGFLNLPSELGVFYFGFELTRKSQSWFGFVAIELLSSSDLKIDHWGIETDLNQSITTTLPSTGDPVPGIGGIAALALGASGVRRSRRRLI